MAGLMILHGFNCKDFIKQKKNVKRKLRSIKLLVNLGGNLLMHMKQQRNIIGWINLRGLFIFRGKYGMRKLVEKNLKNIRLGMSLARNHLAPIMLLIKIIG